MMSQRRRCLHAAAQQEWLRCKRVAHKGMECVVTARVGEEDFRKELEDKLLTWTNEERKAVWLRLDVEDMHLSRVAYDMGFSFHHAKGRESAMVKWLPKDIPNKVPPFGFHQLGVGAMVISKKNEILLVKERYRSIDRWKMPGGMVDPGESLPDAAVREVFEETGIRANFCSVLGFWQRRINPDLSDIYCVSRLTVGEEEAKQINFDRQEISDCVWMPLDEYVNSHDHPMLLAVLDRSFGLQKGQTVPDRPLVPPFELELAGVQVSPTSEPFDCFLARQNNQSAK